jgi:class 3 adenylate cyclase/pimeloyl-ACP methyl ester carboxylesterase
VTEIPETRFTKFGDNRIAYQVVGEGPPDLLWLAGLGEPIDSRWDYPPCASFVRRLASFSRLIMFDRRGIGASDPVPVASLPSWEGWADDATAVLDAVGSTRTILLGAVQGGPTAIMFAATRPERTQALILAVTAARFMRSDDYPWGETEEEADAVADFLAENWGTEGGAVAAFPSHADDPVFRRWIAKSGRMSCSAQEMVTYLRQDNPTDVRQILPSIQVPTLVLHRHDPPFFKLEAGRYLAEHIPGARFEAVPGDDLSIFTKPNAQILAHIEEFVTGGAPSIGSNRVLASVLFTDIVSSTERAAALGDRRWSSLLENHDAMAQDVVDQHGGRLVKLTGDGVLATFDGPGRAIQCGFALRDALDPLGIAIRAGLHTGEVELRGDDIGGIGVHVAARVLEEAEPGQLLASAAVPLLVAGSGIEFEDRGEHELKGVPGSWRLYAVEG